MLNKQKNQPTIKEKKQQEFKNITEYTSFPALYLHNKNKHSVTLKTKEKSKMKKRVVWSGNKKKLVYQFPEKSDESCSQDFSSEEIEHKKPKKIINHKKSNHKLQTFNNQQQDNNLRDVINQFIKFISFHQNFTQYSQNLSLLFEELINFISVSQKSIKFIQKQFQTQTKVSLLPFYLNQFSSEILPKFNNFNLHTNIIFYFLSSLSSWLYFNNFSKNLAILNTNQNLKIQIQSRQQQSIKQNNCIKISSTQENKNLEQSHLNLKQ